MRRSAGLEADAVLFDLDGTLVDSRLPFARSANAALVAHGLAERPDAELHAYLGPPIHETFRRLTGREDVGELVESYRARLREHMVSETSVFPGIAAALAALAARRPLLVATSKPRALAEPLLQALGLRRHFLAVEGPELSADAEPKAVTIGRALAALPPRARAVMVGDRMHDVHGAAAHGLACVGVLWGIGSRRELTDAGAAALVGSPAELETLL